MCDHTCNFYNKTSWPYKRCSVNIINIRTNIQIIGESQRSCTPNPLQDLWFQKNTKKHFRHKIWILFLIALIMYCCIHTFYELFSQLKKNHIYQSQATRFLYIRKIHNRGIKSTYLVNSLIQVLSVPAKPHSFHQPTKYHETRIL